MNAIVVIGTLFVGVKRHTRAPQRKISPPTFPQQTVQILGAPA